MPILHRLLLSFPMGVRINVREDKTEQEKQRKKKMRTKDMREEEQSL